MPYACLACRKSFKRPRVFAPPRYRPCPVCGKPATGLHPDFKPPRTSNVKQWAKVRLLVEAGFRFRPIWDAEKEKSIPYPETLRDAGPWIERFKNLPVTRGGPAVAEPNAAMDRGRATRAGKVRVGRRGAGR